LNPILEKKCRTCDTNEDEEQQLLDDDDAKDEDKREQKRRHEYSSSSHLRVVHVRQWTEQRAARQDDGEFIITFVPERVPVQLSGVILSSDHGNVLATEERFIRDFRNW